MNDIDLSLIPKPKPVSPAPEANTSFVKAAFMMPSQPTQPRKWEDIPWNERNILSKILYVIFCIISGLFGCLILLFIVCMNWGLLQACFHMLDKAFGGSISATAGSIWDVLRQINWWLYPIFIIAYCNRWLRTVSLILTGGVVGYFINPSIGFWA